MSFTTSSTRRRVASVGGMRLPYMPRFDLASKYRAPLGHSARETPGESADEYTFSSLAHFVSADLYPPEPILWGWRFFLAFALPLSLAAYKSGINNS